MLLHRVETYLRVTRTPPARFGRDVLNDPCFVFDLRDGRSVRQKTLKRVTDYLSAREADAEVR